MGPHSLRLRLMLAVALVVLVAVVAVGVAARQATVSRVERFLAEERALDRPLPELEPLAARAIDTAAEDGWPAVSDLLARWLGDVDSDQGLIVLGLQNELLAASDPALNGWRFQAPEAAGGVVEISARRGGEVLQLRVPSAALVAADGRLLGGLYFFPPPPLETTSHQTVFVSSIGRLVLLSVLAAGVAAIALTWAATRRVLRPVEALTRAARDLESGDLTQRVEVGGDDEIGRLGGAFNSMAEALERNQAAMRNMVSDTAHELRTPITNLRCQIEALEDGLTRPDAAALRSLAEEVELLQKLAEDLQLLALADAGELRLETRRCDLAAEAERAAGAALAARPSSGVEVDLDLTGLPAVEADPRRLRQILTNLLLNALEHTPSSGQGSGQIRVRGRPRAGAVEVSVEDDGAGIPAEHLPRIFERYYRPDASRQRATGGSGLGLAIVKQLVEAQGGTLSIDSVEGRGTRVAFRLPSAG